MPARAAQASPAPAPVPVSAPVRTPTPAPTPARAAAPVAPESRGGAFGVHVSSYRKRSTAEADARRLGAELGLPARVVPVDLGARGVWYRAVVGEVGSAAEASALRARLKEKGVPAGAVQRF